MPLEKAVACDTPGTRDADRQVAMQKLLFRAPYNVGRDAAQRARPGHDGRPGAWCRPGHRYQSS